MSLAQLLDGFVAWAAHGLAAWGWGQILVYVLVTTQITIAAVTLYLHRCQAHRALELHPLVSHFFRFWLWISTGMVTREWASVHRKHHARCETIEDPHSPQTRGIGTVLWRGVDLYKAEARNAETIQKYGSGTPDDWIERNVYARHTVLGIVLMLVLDMALFGLAGVTVWAVQMAWIPFHAAGIINGLGHYVGYRNYEAPAPDTSTNLIPWGIWIGGEELHNNHHTYPTSAKFSVKKYEFDLGWLYIRVLQTLGLAKAKKSVPMLSLGAVKSVADAQTLEGIIAHRYQLMASYAAEIRAVCKAELMHLRQKKANLQVMEIARRWLHRDIEQVPASAQAALAQVRSEHAVLDKLVAMREELRQLWQSRSATREQLVHELQQWCQKAEASGITALNRFSYRLKAVRI